MTVRNIAPNIFPNLGWYGFANRKGPRTSDVASFTGIVLVLGGLG